MVRDLEQENEARTFALNQRRCKWEVIEKVAYAVNREMRVMEIRGSEDNKTIDWVTR
jgi:hypothetical protein